MKEKWLLNYEQSLWIQHISLERLKSHKWRDDRFFFSVNHPQCWSQWANGGDTFLLFLSSLALGKLEMSCCPVRQWTLWLPILLEWFAFEKCWHCNNHFSILYGIQQHCGKLEFRHEYCTTSKECSRINVGHHLVTHSIHTRTLERTSDKYASNWIIINVGLMIGEKLIIIRCRRGCWHKIPNMRYSFVTDTIVCDIKVVGICLCECEFINIYFFFFCKQRPYDSIKQWCCYYRLDKVHWLLTFRNPYKRK